MENQLTPLSIATLSKYIFGELPEEELAAIEQSIAEDDYYFRIVENLLDYCERKNILSHQDLEIAFAKEKESIFEEMDALKERREATVEAEKVSGLETIPQRGNYKNRWLWLILIIALVVVSAILIYCYTQLGDPGDTQKDIDKTEKRDVLKTETNSNLDDSPSVKPETDSDKKESTSPKINKKTKPPMAAVILPESERQAIIDAIQFREKTSLTNAGGTNWQSAFLNDSMSIARQLLEQEIQKHPEDGLKIHRYFAGILHLYHEGGDLQKAIDYLENLEKAGSRIRPDITLHLINAYAKNKDITKAKAILEKDPGLSSKLPASVKALLEN